MKSIVDYRELVVRAQIHEAMDQTEHGIKLDQKRFRLLLSIQPTEDELRVWPFLRDHGGIGTIGRHPIFIHYCDVFTMYRLWKRSLETLEEVKENVVDYETRASQAKGKIESALRVLNDLKWISEEVQEGRSFNPEKIYMDDLLRTGRYYCYQKLSKEK